MSVAFTKEESAETASETQLPDRPISPHPNLVTSTGFEALRSDLEIARKAYEQAQLTADVNEKRRLSASPLRDIRYLTERLRTAQVVAFQLPTMLLHSATRLHSAVRMGVSRPIESLARMKPIPRTDRFRLFRQSPDP